MREARSAVVSIGRILTNALVAVVQSDAIVDVAPVGSPEVHPDAGAVFVGMVERLELGDEGGPIVLVLVLVRAGAVIVELDDVLEVLRLGHLVHHSVEPLEGPLPPRRPVEVGPTRPERVVAGAGLEVAILLPHAVDDVLDDGGHGCHADAEAARRRTACSTAPARRRGHRSAPSGSCT
jgi:hypothetical protein